MSNNAMGAALLGLSLGVLTLAATADDQYTAPSVEQGPTVKMVNDMLLIDARRAAIAERERLLEALGRKPDKTVKPVSPQPTVEARPAEVTTQVKQPEAPAPVVLDLQGIFGLGTNLYADVSINGQVVRFQRGRSLPLGMADYKFHLSSIEVPCVKLKQGDTLFTTCLTASGL
ncbi:hypothetical protein [Pseudomonas cannabina]|uniref:hypothetical protein n=1 Tax=Pseudomonas cannabina TaxID=86840 RepID=UPI000F008643|nr:hypothetical protein [Pseudomonas cannabina]